MYFNLQHGRLLVTALLAAWLGPSAAAPYVHRSAWFGSDSAFSGGPALSERDLGLSAVAPRPPGGAGKCPCPCSPTGPFKHAGRRAASHRGRPPGPHVRRHGMAFGRGFRRRAGDVAWRRRESAARQPHRSARPAVPVTSSAT